MTASAFCAAMDNLIAGVSAQTGFARFDPDVPTNASYLVFDSAEADTSSEDIPFVAIGYASAADDGSGRSNLGPGSIGTNRPRSEDGEIRCWAYATGDSPKAARDLVKLIMDGVDAACRTAPTSIVGTSQTIKWGFISQIDWSHGSGNGFDAGALFTVSYTAQV